MNHVALVGRLGKDPETKQVGDKQVTKFSLATKGYGDTTDWHNIECWGKTAELAAKYLTKGSMCGVNGSIRYSKNGDKFYTNIVADKIEFLSSKTQDTAPAMTASVPDLDNLDF